MPFAPKVRRVNLYISHYTDKNEQRNKELLQCFQRNINCKEITKIYAICQDETGCSLLAHPKVTVILIKSRPTYNVFFQIIKQTSQVNDINIIANSDIFFDSTISQIARYDKPRVCVALTRWELNANGSIHFLNRADSQDCWLFKGHPNVNGDFYMGQPGCDNVIADRFYKSGYQVINPSRTIKTYHIHTSNIRNYNVNNRLQPPYKLIQPTI